MFKQMLENKIGEKLTTFGINQSSKQAIEWMGKFRQSLDATTEKIQAQFSRNSSDESVAQPQPQRVDSPPLQMAENSARRMKGALKSEPTIDDEFGLSASPDSPPSSTPSPPARSNSIRKSLKLNASFKSASNSHQTHRKAPPIQTQNSLQVNHINDEDSSSSSPSFNNLLSNSSTSLKHINDHHQTSNRLQYQPRSTATEEGSSQGVNNHNHNHDEDKEESMTSLSSLPASGSGSGSSQSYTSQHRSLVRQSTDLTSSFPLKPFQRINSETVEVPGLNVKVVRYRVANDLGKIDPHLYINYNMGGADAASCVAKAKLFFSLRYSPDIQSLTVTIKKAEIFASGNFQNGRISSVNSSNIHSAPGSPNLSKPDTYVKVQLLPDKKRKFQTRIQRKSIAPAFDETFYFQLPIDQLQDRTLHLSLFEFGRFSKHELIGSMRMNDWSSIKDLSTSEVEFVRNLAPLADDDLDLGELTLTLCYLPAAGRLTVTIVKAINLKAMDINGKSDPYVKVTLVSKGKRVKKKKTSVMKNTLHPVFNESMLFDIPQDQIESVDMVVKVIDYDRVGSNELIGCIGIGPAFSGLGRDHWYRMLENPRKPITQAYYLKDATFLREGLPAKVERALHADRQESTESKNSSSDR